MGNWWRGSLNADRLPIFQKLYRGKLSVLLAPARKVPTAGSGEGNLKEAGLGSS